jgi:Dockerin type I domain
LLAADVNADGVVSPIDVLIVINRLKRTASNPSASFSLRSEQVIFPDTNNDKDLTPIDVLIVINQLQRQSAAVDGEASSIKINETEIDDAVIDLLAEDQRMLRRRKAKS